MSSQVSNIKKRNSCANEEVSNEKIKRLLIHEDDVVCDSTGADDSFNRQECSEEDGHNVSGEQLSATPPSSEGSVTETKLVPKEEPLYKLCFIDEYTHKTRMFGVRKSDLPLSGAFHKLEVGISMELESATLISHPHVDLRGDMTLSTLIENDKENRDIQFLYRPDLPLLHNSEKRCEITLVEIDKNGSTQGTPRVKYLLTEVMYCYQLIMKLYEKSFAHIRPAPNAYLNLYDNPTDHSQQGTYPFKLIRESCTFYYRILPISYREDARTNYVQARSFEDPNKVIYFPVPTGIKGQYYISHLYGILMKYIRPGYKSGLSNVQTTSLHNRICCVLANKMEGTNMYQMMNGLNQYLTDTPACFKNIHFKIMSLHDTVEVFMEGFMQQPPVNSLKVTTPRTIVKKSKK